MDKKQKHQPNCHIRRCHVCGTISENPDSSVKQCQCCEKHLAPFFYFDDRYSPVYGDTTLRPHFTEGEFLPIYGLTAYWE